MAKEKILIEFNEIDLKKMIAKIYNLNLDTMLLSVEYYPGDSRESEYTNIKVIGEKIN